MSNRLIVQMVAPLLDKPAKQAIPCATPVINRGSTPFSPTENLFLLRLESKSRAAVKAKPTGRMYLSMPSGRKNLTAAAIINVGMLAMTRYKRRLSEIGCRRICSSGFLYAIMTAKSVPTCSITLMKSGHSTPVSAETRSKCPLLETGRNSVKP